MKIQPKPTSTLEGNCQRISMDTLRMGTVLSGRHLPRTQYNFDNNDNSVYRTINSTTQDFNTALASGITFPANSDRVIPVPEGVCFFGTELRKNLVETYAPILAMAKGSYLLTVFGVLLIEASFKPVVVLTSTGTVCPDTYLNNPTDKVEYINTFGNSSVVYQKQIGRIPPGIKNIAFKIGPDYDATPIVDGGDLDLIIHFW